MKILDGAINKLETMEATFSECFPYPSLSSASTDFKAIDPATESNEKVAKAVSTSLDEIASVAQDVKAIEVFLHLHIPKMEDGNNFGVTVQLALLKQLSDLEEMASKKIDELSGYSSARADALDKLKLPSTSFSVTKSSSQSETDGKKEQKLSESTEEKKSSSDTTGPAFQTRAAALVATDTLYYSKAKQAFQSVMTLYMAV